ncbi:hypothetical protein BH23PLA1_BH23PLA1_06140 [soil metagenome]
MEIGEMFPSTGWATISPGGLSLLDLSPMLKGRQRRLSNADFDLFEEHPCAFDSERSLSRCC